LGVDWLDEGLTHNVTDQGLAKSRNFGGNMNAEKSKGASGNDSAASPVKRLVLLLFWVGSYLFWFAAYLDYARLHNIKQYHYLWILYGWLCIYAPFVFANAAKFLLKKLLKW